VSELALDVRDVVADPFVGSGTTAVVAARLGRRPLATDRSPSYVALTRAALAGALPAAA
jgi:modification methylase